MTTAPPPAIELRGLHRLFQDTHAVRGVTFSVARGEVFGFIGPNGAGKTTSMRILATLDEPSAGDAFVDGLSVTEDPDRVRRRLGFMPDYYGSYENVSVLEYLDFFARAYGLSGRQRHEAIRETIDFTGLGPLKNKPIEGLSKGMKQRLALGRTMIHDPLVMVLDEPAAGLDPRARYELRDMIARLAERGKAVLLSSHILTELAEVCHRVGIIEKGELLAVGGIEEISQSYAEQRRITIRVLERSEELQSWLNEQSAVVTCNRSGDQLIVNFAGDPAAQADLLKEIITTGFLVSEFAGGALSLEDVFLQVTEGHVQ